jgi:capsular polysaccharide biosynthesis protein
VNHSDDGYGSSQINQDYDFTLGTVCFHHKRPQELVLQGNNNAKKRHGGTPLDLVSDSSLAVAHCPLYVAGDGGFIVALDAPVYSTSAILLVNADSSATMSDYNTIVASERLVLTYSQMLTRRSVLEAVIEQLGLPETPETLAGRVKATPVKDTQLILLSVEDGDPVRVARIANTIAETFTAQIEELRQAGLQGNVRVAIAETAWEPREPISRHTLYVALAGLVSGVLALGMAFLIEYLINTIKTPDNVSEALGLNTIGAIGRLARGEQELLWIDPPSPVAEVHVAHQSSVLLH